MTNHCGSCDPPCNQRKTAGHPVCSPPCNQTIVYKPTPNAKVCTRVVPQCPPVKKCVKICKPPVCCPSNCNAKH